MKVERVVVQPCKCSGPHIVFKIGRPIDKALLEFLKSNGFTEAANFTQAGLLYADNLDLIITGPFGANKIQAKCKKANCDQIFNDFEELLVRTG
jgi:hypothetical protein